MNAVIIVAAWMAIAEPSAQSDISRDALIAQAVERYGDKDYEQAIALFERAYRLEHRAVDLYNIGRVYEDLGEPDRARGYYERFLNRDDLTTEERTEGAKRLSALPPQTQAAEVANEGTTDGSEVEEPKRRRRRHRSSGERDRVPPGARWAVITGSTLIPVGVASLVSGTVLATTAVRNADNARSSADEQTSFEQTPHYAVARRQAIAADVLLIGGGVVAATGVLMIVAGYDHKGRKARSKRKRVGRVAVSPMGAGAQVHIRF